MPMLCWVLFFSSYRINAFSFSSVALPDLTLMLVFKPVLQCVDCLHECHTNCTLWVIPVIFWSFSSSQPAASKTHPPVFGKQRVSVLYEKHRLHKSVQRRSDKGNMGENIRCWDLEVECGHAVLIAKIQERKSKGLHRMHLFWVC